MAEEAVRVWTPAFSPKLLTLSARVFELWRAESNHPVRMVVDLPLPGDAPPPGPRMGASDWAGRELIQGIDRCMPPEVLLPLWADD